MLLSSKIREFRFKYGEMTQKQLAERVSRQTMNAIENGRHAPTVDVAIRIADVFGLAVDELFELDYDGRPVHREPVTTRAVHRVEAAVVEPVVIGGGAEPSEAGADRPASFADLGKILDT